MSYDDDEHWYTNDWEDDANLDYVRTPPRSPREKCSKFAQYLSAWFKMADVKKIERNLHIKSMSEIRTISIGQIHKLEFLSDEEQAKLAEVLTLYDDFDRIDTPEHSPRPAHKKADIHKQKDPDGLFKLLGQLSTESANAILIRVGLQSCAKQLCDECKLNTMQDLANLSDEHVDSLTFLREQQPIKLKALCEACREGNPDNIKAILRRRKAYTKT
jgi:hypothetical protein